MGLVVVVLLFGDRKKGGGRMIVGVLWLGCTGFVDG
jgi:hypothetical protein